MASKTDVHSLFFGDEASVETQFLRHWGKDNTVKEDDQIVCSVRFQAPGETTMPEVVRKSGKASTLKGSGARNFLEAVVEELLVKIGRAPLGPIRVKLWPDGSAKEPWIDMSRRLVPPEGLGEPNVEMLKVENARLTRMNEEFARSLVNAMGHQAAILVEQSKTIGQLGAMRATAASAADAGGISGIMGMVVLYMLLPVIRKVMKLPPDANLEQISERVSAYVVGQAEATLGSLSGDKPATARPDAPAGALSGSAPAALTATEAVEIAATAKHDPDAVIKLAENDKAFRDKLLMLALPLIKREIDKDPVQKQILGSALDMTPNK